MEFTGAVVACEKAFDSLWAVRINAGDIDVIGYTRDRVQIGQNITMRGYPLPSGTTIHINNSWITNDAFPS